MSRFDEINFPEYKREVQMPLFGTKDEDIYYHKWPKYGRDFNRVFENPNKNKLIGLDLEFDVETKKCSILGISSGEYSASNPYDRKVVKDLLDLCKDGYKLVGFSINGAEKEILEHELQEEIPLSFFEDTMILFYLCFSHLTKTSQGKDNYEKGSLGFINLWTSASILTDLPQWKLCRELQCEGPCPKHDVWGYNAIDAYAGLVGFEELIKIADNYGLPYSLYRDVLTLTEITQKMRNNGIKVNRKLAKELDTVTIEEKYSLFDVEEPPFNPNSPTEAVEWFKKKGIKLKSFSKLDLLAEIKKLSTKKGVTIEEFQLIEDLDITESWLVKSAQYKGLGKGLKAWFDDRYFDGDDELLHPRFITTGASNGRWSSSGPNCQNFPSMKDD